MNNLNNEYMPDYSDADKQNCLFVVAQGRSGSTLLLRILNEIPGYNICGENWGAIMGLSLYYNKIITTMNSPEFIRKEDYEKKNIKPAWYNIFNREKIRSDLRVLLKNMYNPHDEYKVWGYKEIRYGLDSTYEPFESHLLFLKDLFPNTKFIFNTRNIDDLLKSLLTHGWIKRNGWWKNSKRAKKLLLCQENHFRKFCNTNKEFCFLLSYEHDVLEKSKHFIELFSFLGENFDEGNYLEIITKKL